MANVLVDESSLQNIASAIRTKAGIQDTYTPAEMSTAIENIPAGENPVLPTKVCFGTAKSTFTSFPDLEKCDTSNITDAFEMFNRMYIISNSTNV